MNSSFDAQPSGTSRPEAVAINAALSVTLLVAANRTTESIMSIYCDTLTAKHKKGSWGREGRLAALLVRLLGWLSFI